MRLQLGPLPSHQNVTKRHETSRSSGTQMLPDYHLLIVVPCHQTARVPVQLSAAPGAPPSGLITSEEVIKRRLITGFTKNVTLLSGDPGDAWRREREFN